MLIPRIRTTHTHTHTHTSFLSLCHSLSVSIAFSPNSSLYLSPFPIPSLSLLSAYRDQMDVNLLLKALQTTLRFEQEMASRFGAPTSAIPTSTPIATVRDSGKENNHSFPYSTAVPRAPETQVRVGGMYAHVVPW